MISRLLLTTAIGFALGTAAFAQGAADPATTDSDTPAAQTESQAPAGGASTANATVTLSAGVSVTEPERARIGESVARMNVRSLRGVDFSVSVGSKVPRELRTYSLPAEVGQIVPPYRNYRFLVVDKRILIVEPSTQKIVTILPPAGAPTATAAAAIPVPAIPAPAASAPAASTPVTAAPAPAIPAPSTSTGSTSTISTASVPAPSPSTTATADQPSAPGRESAAEPQRPKAKKQAARTQRRTVSRAERDDWRRANADVRVGQRVPDDVVLYRLPPRYYREVPAAREYRYRGYATGWRGRTVYQEFD